MYKNPKPIYLIYYFFYIFYEFYFFYDMGKCKLN